MININYQAFRNCSMLTEVNIFAVSLQTYGSNAFQGTPDGLKIYVPAASVDTYKAGWNAYADKIQALPTYAVTFAEGTDPNEWTASPNADVKKGQTVTVTYSGTKKILGVKAEKKAKVLTITVAKGPSDLSGDKLLYYTPGETYRQAIANHPENKLDGGLGWNIWEGGNDATIFYKESADKSRDLSIDGDQHFRPTDSINLDTVIDPTLNFYFVAQF